MDSHLLTSVEDHLGTGGQGVNTCFDSVKALLFWRGLWLPSGKRRD